MSEAAIYLNTLPAPVPPAPATSTFYFDDRRITVVMVAGEPWFVAGEIAEVLGHRSAAEVTRLLKDKHRGTHSVRTPGGLQSVTVISEPGFYQAVLSRKPTAKAMPGMIERIERFQDWVTEEVLPSIRRTGSYGVPTVQAPVAQGAALLDLMRNPAVALELIGHYAAANISLQEKVEAAAPAVAFQQALVETDDTFGLQQAGKSLGQAPNGFVNWLLGRGDIYRRNGLCARQHLIDRGLYTMGWEEFGGKPRPVTRLTGKGVVHYAKILGVRPPEPPRQGALPGI